MKSEGEIALPKSRLATSAGKLTSWFFPRHELSLVKPVKKDEIIGRSYLPKISKFDEEEGGCCPRDDDIY